jgi:hypothetical protein
MEGARKLLSMDERPAKKGMTRREASDLRHQNVLARRAAEAAAAATPTDTTEPVE